MFKKRVRKSGPFTRWELKKIKRSFELRKLECNLFLSYKNHEKKIEFDDLLRAISSFSKHSESKNEKILLTEVLSL